jgi:hypothetical protein
MHIEIVIPTIGGREHYLSWCLRSCLEQDSSTSVLVSSNGGSKTVRELIASLDTSRIRLVETEKVVPMAFHWEFAVSQARGDVISIIGDDDALLPHSLTAIREVFEMHPDVECVTQRPAQYYWPDFPIESHRNRYVVPVCNGGRTFYETKPILKRVMEFKAWYGTLPFLYHGFVRRETLDRIRLSHGGLFKRIAPDIYSDLLLAASINKFIVVDKVLSIGGQGAKSNGANLALNTIQGRQFFEDLPAELQPRLCAKSIMLQLYEYVAIFREGALSDIDLSPYWTKFALQTIVEAIRMPDFRHEILDDLVGIAKNAFPVPPKLFVLSLVRMCRIDSVSDLLGWALKMRLGRRVATWHDAKSTLGITNVFDLACSLAVNQR